MAHVLIPMARFAKAKNAQAIVNALQDAAIWMVEKGFVWTSLIRAVDALRIAIVNRTVAKRRNGEERSIASDH